MLCPVFVVLQSAAARCVRFYWRWATLSEIGPEALEQMALKALRLASGTSPYQELDRADAVQSPELLAAAVSGTSAFAESPQFAHLVAQSSGLARRLADTEDVGRPSSQHAVSPGPQHAGVGWLGMLRVARVGCDGTGMPTGKAHGVDAGRVGDLPPGCSFRATFRSQQCVRRNDFRRLSRKAIDVGYLHGALLRSFASVRAPRFTMWDFYIQHLLVR